MIPPSIVNDLGRDLAYALRQIRRQPAFAAVIVLSLGVAMGVNTSFFSMFNAGTLKPWPVKDPDRVVAVHARVTLAEWRHWAAQASSLSGVTARLASGTARAEGRRLHFDFVSANYFDVLSPLARGHAFPPDDDRPGGAGTAAVISHRLWETDFARDPDILGKTVRLDGVPFTIVGVAASAFDGAGRGRRDLWLPLAAFGRLRPADEAGDWRELQRHVAVAGRLAPGGSADVARAELTTLSERFRSQHGIPREPITVTDTRPFSHQGAADRAFAGLFFTAITFATLIACASVANLLLARGNARRGEIAMRLALGAGRSRVVRQLLTEAFVLAAMASLLGIAVAHVLPPWMTSTVPELAYRMPSDFRLDYRVFVYALGLSTVACVAFGLLPALQCTRLSVSHALKDAHGQSVPSLRTSLPAYQVIVSVMLLTASGLLVRSIQQLTTRELGFSVDHLLLVGLEPPSTHARTQRGALTRAVMDELGTLAGRQNVGAASDGPSPGRPAGAEMHFELDAGGVRTPGTASSVQVAGAYFDLLRLPIVAGRAFTATDVPGRAAMVNEAFVRQLSPAGSPVGKAILQGGHRREIVGVVRDAYLGNLDAVEPIVFEPAAPEALRVLLVRDTGDGLSAAIRPLVARLDPSAYAEVQTGPAWMARVTSLSLFGARMVGGLSVLTLALATLGLFSVSAYTVQQRTREIGIRRALGAQPRHVLQAVLAPAGGAMARGVLVGGAGALALAFLMRRWDWLMGLSPLDPLTYVGVFAVLAGAGLLATYLPARRALRVDPMVALRYE